MKEPTFDVFRGPSEEDALWVETVRGFENATQRMERRAVETPGDYFLFDCSTSTVVARTNPPRRIQLREAQSE